MKEVALSMGGAFNPVHSQHVAIMVEAKNFLENIGEGTVYKVVGGCLGAAPDGYVIRKMQKVIYIYNIRTKTRTKKQNTNIQQILIYYFLFLFSFVPILEGGACHSWRTPRGNV